jgi:uncharacterized protein DUF6788
MARDFSMMTVAQLVEQRALVLARLSAVPEFRRGSLRVGYFKCGKSNCRCARPGEEGHGPRALWTDKVKGRSRGQQIPLGQVDQVRAELDNYAQFAAILEDFVEVNSALCRARIGPGTARSQPADPGSVGQKGGSRTGPMRSGATGRTRDQTTKKR